MSTSPVTPANIFIEFWQLANAMTGFQRQTAEIADNDLNRTIAAALMQDNAQDVATSLTQIHAGHSRLAIDTNGCILSIMRAIDELFYHIHPRAQFIPSARPKMPRWLREMRGRRTSFGHYAQNADWRLVTRGPLVRRDRDETASNAECLADYFSALAVVPHTVIHNQKKLAIQHTVISTGTAQGVRAAKNAGAEKVVFIPVAEEADHLLISEREVNAQKYADFRLAPPLNAAETIIKALNACEAADIALAPEFVVTEEHADELAAQLHSVSTPPRLLLAGSGQTISRNSDDLPWNEARMLNTIGCELWRQRKIWPAGSAASTAKNYGMQDPGDKLNMEDTAEGDCIVIADIDGLGRCVVFICQDCKLSPAALQIIENYQPDWVFVPILDAGINMGRWAHQQGFALSENSLARFMIVSSTALAKLAYPNEERACALALGPKAPTEHDKGRMLCEVHIEAGSNPGYGTLHWRHGDWQQSILGSKDSK